MFSYDVQKISRNRIIPWKFDESKYKFLKIFRKISFQIIFQELTKKIIHTLAIGNFSKRYRDDSSIAFDSKAFLRES